jgi:hypothetical protein
VQRLHNSALVAAAASDNPQAKPHASLLLSFVQGRVFALEFTNASWAETTTLIPTDFLTRASP